MKPIIVYAKEHSGKITVCKADFEKAIADAYDQGLADGISTKTNPVKPTIYRDNFGILHTAEDNVPDISQLHKDLTKQMEKDFKRGSTTIKNPDEGAVHENHD